MADQNIVSRESENDAEFDPQMLATNPERRYLARLETHLQNLYAAAMNGEWQTAKKIINNYPNAKTTKISPLGFTALHVAASCGRSEFVVELVKELNKDELQIKDQVGRTALHHVAVAATVRAAKAIVEKNPSLPKIGDMNLQIPLLYAAQWRHKSRSKEMLEYLYQATEAEGRSAAFRSDSASNLIVAITASRSYGIRKQSELKRRYLDAVNLAEFVCKELQQKNITFIQEFFIPKDDTAILHLAIEHGVLELVQICLKHFPDLIWYSNKERLLLHVAIEHRRVNVFNYMTNLIGENTKSCAEFVDRHLNNSLHLAAKLAPSPQLQSVPGPAFQMLREVQWFKAVKALVLHESKKGRNKTKKTPKDLFIKEHETLLQDAKTWMKDISNSCMVVSALVATVAFAAMITVPGGNDSSTGIPILSNQKLFVAFTVSNGLSMISSAISLLVFVALQTSRYTEKDFLDSLPAILLSGLICLFIAIATMMISFGTAIGLSLQRRIFNRAYIPITVVACCPAIIFYNLQIPLLIQTLLSTLGPGIFKGRRDSKFRNLLPQFVTTKNKL